MEKKTESFIDAVACEIQRKKEEAESVLLNAVTEFSKTGNENNFAEALVKVKNLRDGAVNDALNIGDITLAELEKTLLDTENLIKEYQNSAKDFYENLTMLKDAYGEESDAYKNMKYLNLKIENELYSLYHDRDELISRINSTKKMMDEL
jgi:hypothetical protein